MDEALIRILLRHAEYSFACVGWDFDQLTDIEKEVVRNQETLDRRKKIRDEKLGKPLIEVLADEDEENGQFPLFV